MQIFTPPCVDLWWLMGGTTQCEMPDEMLGRCSACVLLG